MLLGLCPVIEYGGAEMVTGAASNVDVNAGIVAGATIVGTCLAVLKGTAVMIAGAPRIAAGVAGTASGVAFIVAGIAVRRSIVAVKLVGASWECHACRCFAAWLAKRRGLRVVLCSFHCISRGCDCCQACDRRCAHCS